jgi:hypothetical protein
MQTGRIALFTNNARPQSHIPAWRRQLSGVQEILVILLIVLAIFFIPRLGGRKAPDRHRPPDAARRLRTLPVHFRLAIVVSVLWPAAAAAYFQPWHRDPIPFFYIGLGPVALVWAIGWVVAGLKNKQG